MRPSETRVAASEGHADQRLRWLRTREAPTGKLILVIPQWRDDTGGRPRQGRPLFLRRIFAHFFSPFGVVELLRLRGGSCRRRGGGGGGSRGGGGAGGCFDGGTG